MRHRMSKQIKRFYAVKPLKIVYSEGNYHIASYFQICPVSGEPTEDEFFTILDSNFKDTDGTAYDSLDLCKLVLSHNSMGDQDRIKQLVSEFNLMNREKLGDQRENDIYS